MALYEDLTMLNIANVKIKPGRYGKESTFNCILAMNEKSELIRPTPSFTLPSPLECPFFVDYAD